MVLLAAVWSRSVGALPRQGRYPDTEVWVKETMEPIGDDEERLEEWMEVAYPCGLPVVYIDQDQYIYE